MTVAPQVYPRVLVAGLPVLDVAPGMVHELAAELLDGASDRPIFVFALHVSSINASDDEKFRRAVAAADVTYADGISVAALARLAGARKVEKLATPDLAPHVLRAVAARKGAPVRVAIIGADEGLARRAGAALEQCFGVEVVAAFSGYEADWDAVAAQVAEVAPDVILLGMGMPLEAKWCAEYGHALPRAIVLTCGAWIRILAGVEKRAPRAWQVSGLEWLYRLASDPSRFARRYATGSVAVLRIGAGVLLRRALGA